MIKEKNKKPGPIEIDLTGPEGNLFVLLGYAKTFSKQLGIDPKEVRMKMIASNYENAVRVFDYYFGGFVILYR